MDSDTVYICLFLSVSPGRKEPLRPVFFLLPDNRKIPCASGKHCKFQCKHPRQNITRTKVSALPGLFSNLFFSPGTFPLPGQTTALPVPFSPSVFFKPHSVSGPAFFFLKTKPLKIASNRCTSNIEIPDSPRMRIIPGNVKNTYKQNRKTRKQTKPEESRRLKACAIPCPKFSLLRWLNTSIMLQLCLIRSPFFSRNTHGCHGLFCRPFHICH